MRWLWRYLEGVSRFSVHALKDGFEMDVLTSRWDCGRRLEGLSGGVDVESRNFDGERMLWSTPDWVLPI